MNALRRSRLETLMLFAAMLVAGIVFYSGIYLSLLNGKLYSPTGVDPSSGQNLFSISPKYRVESHVIAQALAPAHWFDERLRTDYWMTVESLSGRKWKNPPPSVSP